jgi:hypothetical protein
MRERVAKGASAVDKPVVYAADRLSCVKIV